MICLSVFFNIICGFLHLGWDFGVSLSFLLLHSVGDFDSVGHHNFGALSLSQPRVSLILLLWLLCQKFSYQILFCLLGVQSFLDLLLVHDHFSVTTFSFFACKFVIVFGFFDFVHCCRITEVLNLTWWNSSFLLLSLNGFLNGDVLFDTQFGHILLKLLYSIN